MNDFLDSAQRDRVIGVDLGGTNLRVALYQGLAGHVRGRRSPGRLEPVVQARLEIGEQRSPAQVADLLASTIKDVVRRAECEGSVVPVGVGFAGMLRGKTGMVANAPQFAWLDVDFGALVRERLGPLHRIALINDVNAIAWGECTLGAAAGATDALAVFVGTGIGGGVIAAGRLVDGADNCAAEIGHTKVVWDTSARPCACGLKGCVEAYLGGRNLQRRARAELRGGARSLAVRLAGGADKVNPGHLDAAAAEGDDYALGLYGEIAPLLGVAIANAVTLLNPSHLILGGGVLSRTPVLTEHVIAAFEVAVNPPALVALSIVEAALGDEAGLIGSALLAGVT